MTGTSRNRPILEIVADAGLTCLAEKDANGWWIGIET